MPGAGPGVAASSIPVFADDPEVELILVLGAFLLIDAVYSSAAPNAGAAANNQPKELAQIPEVFERRCEYVLALAASQGYKNLVLGAWGCGVFRNDPEIVARAFATHLRGGVWFGRFDHVIFSVLDSSAAQDTFSAFQRAVTKE